MAISPLIEYSAGKLGTIIDGNGFRKSDSFSGFLKCRGDFAPTDGRIGQKQWASSDVLIDNGENAEGAAIGQPIAHKVHRPALLGAEAAGSDTRHCAARFFRFFVRTSSPTAL